MHNISLRVLKDNFPPLAECLMAEEQHNLHNKCLTILQNQCLLAGIRGFSTTLLLAYYSFDFSDRVPGTKVIHHLRDPRSVYYSQKMRGASVNSVTLLTSIRNVCRHMTYDLRKYYSMRKKVGYRMIQTVFDQYVEDPFITVKAVFEFLETDFAAFDRTRYTQEIKRIKERYYVKGTPTVQWVSSMKTNTKNSINDICSYVIEQLGYDRDPGF